MVHHTKANGRLESVEVQEVAQRADTAGRTFFRYNAGDAKSRNRAMRQAIRAAESDCGIAGVKIGDAGVPVNVLADAEGTAAPEVLTEASPE